MIFPSKNSTFSPKFLKNPTFFTKFTQNPQKNDTKNNKILQNNKKIHIFMNFP